MKNADSEFGSITATERLSNFFSAQLNLVARLRDLSRVRTEHRWCVIYPLLYSIVDSGDSFRNLARNEKVRDCYVLGRVLYETLVNALFMLAQGYSAAERAIRHARQKSIRDLDRTIQVGARTLKVKSSAADFVATDPQIQQIISEFTTKKGREITSWTPENVVQRIETIERHFGQKISTSLIFGLTIYRHSSDIAHGTLFGALFSLGLNVPGGAPESPAALEKHFREQLSMFICFLASASTLSSWQ